MNFAYNFCAQAHNSTLFASGGGDNSEIVHVYPMVCTSGCRDVSRLSFCLWLCLSFGFPWLWALLSSWFCLSRGFAFGFTSVYLVAWLLSWLCLSHGFAGLLALLGFCLSFGFACLLVLRVLCLAHGFAGLVAVPTSWRSFCSWFYWVRGFSCLLASLIFWLCFFLGLLVSWPGLACLLTWLCLTSGLADILAWLVLWLVFWLDLLLGSGCLSVLSASYLLALLLSWFACLLAWPGLSLDLALFDFWLS
jgi:hypothetical protein